MWFFRLRKMFRVAGRDALVLFFAIRDPRTPRALKLAAGAALAWILSPIDPLPDLPLIGWVDDMLVLSVALPMLIRRLPEAVRLEANLRADRFTAVWWPARPTGASVDGKPADVLDPEPGRVVRARRAATATAGRATAAAMAAGAVVVAAAKAAGTRAVAKQAGSAPRPTAESVPRTTAKPAPRKQAKPAPRKQTKPAPQTQAKPAPQTQSKPAPRTRSTPASGTQVAAPPDGTPDGAPPSGKRPARGAGMPRAARKSGAQ